MLQILLQEPAGGGMGSLLLLVGIMVIFFIFMIRPQMKKQKFREGLKKGDSVVTIGGIFGKIVEVKGDNSVLLEVSKDVVIKISKSALLKDPADVGEQQK